MLILRALVVAAFLLGGGANLLGAHPIAEQFTEFGLRKAAMYSVGALEVAGAIGLFVEPVRAWAAIGLAGLMVGAVANHLKARLKLDKVAPSAVLLLLAGLFAVGLW